MAKKLLRILVVVSIFWVAIVVVISPAPLQRDIARDLPWTLPDYRRANVSWHVGNDGRIYNQLDHFLLKDISPEMIAWFYQQLPISTVELNGTTYPLYHLFHPSEHGRIRVKEPAPSGAKGMAKGAIIEREEWFGRFDSKGAATMVEFSDTGMVAMPNIAGIQLGRIEHIYRASKAGSHYRVEAVIGSDLPVLGRLLNWYLRTWVFHPEMMAQWQRHQIEEVASLAFFLPQLYAQRDHSSNNHFNLVITSEH
jgi:hypothetical protein